MADKDPKQSADEKDAKLEPGDEIILSVSADQELSAEALDEFLGETDPDFVKKMSEVQKDNNLSFSEVELTAEEQALADEKDWWSNSGRLLKIIYILFPLAPRMSLGLKKLKYKFFVLLRGAWVRAKNFGYFLRTEGKDNTILVFKKGLKSITGIIVGSASAFKSLSTKLKLAFLGLILATAAVAFILMKVFKQDLIPEEKTLFIQSFDQVADHAFKYDPSKNMEPLFDNLRTSSNVYLMPRMVVNIQKSENSSDNPMAAIEIFIEGMTPEVAVEVKDRESEFRDFLQRELEQMNYDKLLSQDGKVEMLDLLKIELNKELVSGKVRRIYIKTIILKP